MILSNIYFLIYNFYFMYMDALPAYMSVYHMNAQSLEDSLWLEFHEWEPEGWCKEWNPSLLEE